QARQLPLWIHNMNPPPDLCNRAVEALKEATAWHGTPEIMNSDHPRISGSNIVACTNTTCPD
ncbi:hypothetical protein, partial [Parasedimentitalea psychrophila]|uniref:hypothetical protein n=1 Tax=Parasedimentitalea psychrophila TaxID=2997337 RepID=UPI0022EB643B